MCLSAHRHKKNRVLLPDIKSSGRTLHADKGLCTELKFRLHKQGPYKCCSAPQNKTTALSLCCDTTRLFKGSYFISASQPLEDMLKEKCAFGQEKLGRGVSCECFFLFREGDEQESPSFSWPSEGFWSYRLLFFFFFNTGTDKASNTLGLQPAQREVVNYLAKESLELSDTAFPLLWYCFEEHGAANTCFLIQRTMPLRQQVILNSWQNFCIPTF